jgi:hypothetical protein
LSSPSEDEPPRDTEREFRVTDGVKPSSHKASPWELWVALFVALGMAATIGWTVFETYWG